MKGFILMFFQEELDSLLSAGMPFSWDLEGLKVKRRLKTLKNITPFCGWSSTALRLEPLRGGSLLFTTKFPESPSLFLKETLTSAH